MPSITLSDMSLTRPDGDVLFSGIDLTFAAERSGLVGRNGIGKSSLLRIIAGDLAPSSGQVRVDGTLGIMPQLASVSDDAIVADLFGAREGLALLSRAEAGEASLDDLASADWTLAERITGALSRMGLETPPETLLASLSGGQRTRAAIAAALRGEPDFLLLDEPTNNLDRTGRAAVIDLISTWRKGAIIVSHDRELLERVDAIVEMTTLGATRFGGGWSAYRARKELDLAAAEHDAAQADKAMAEARERARVAAERSARRAAAGAREASRGGQPRIAAGLRQQNAEGAQGASRRLNQLRQEAAATALGEAREKIERLRDLSIPLSPSGLAMGRRVLDLEAVTAGYPGRPAVIRDLSFTISGPERVAVTGPNGSGKTTLLQLIDGRTSPAAGTVRLSVPAAMLDQRLGNLDPDLSVLENFRRLNPGTSDNAARAALAGFLFRADAALQTVSTLSGGQLLRAGLACALGGAAPPQLLILDEPTNHLDLDSIAAVEAALAAYDGALLVVSHDEVFLDAIGIERRLELG